jgi:energy-converting hydrogenase B subunit D
MSAVRAALLVLVALGGAAVVLTREPLRQAIVVGVYGLLLALLFFAVQAPDVALSQLVVSTVAVPLMILLALAKVRGHEEESSRGDDRAATRVHERQGSRRAGGDRE